MTFARAQIFDGALAKLCTEGTTWTDGTLKAKFINDQAFNRTALVSDYTSTLGAVVTITSPAYLTDLTNNNIGLDCDDITSSAAGGTVHADTMIVYKSDDDYPLFYMPFTDETVTIGNQVKYVPVAGGLIQLMGSCPIIMKNWLLGAYDLTDFPGSLTVYTVATQPTAITMSTLTPTSTKQDIGIILINDTTAWAGGNFQICMKTSPFKLTVNAGLMHGLVIGDEDADLIYAYIPLIRNIEQEEKIHFNIPDTGIFCIGGL